MRTLYSMNCSTLARFGFILGAGLFGSVYAAQATPAPVSQVEQANLAFKLFTKTCLAMPDNNAAVSAWATKNHFIKPEPKTSNMILQNRGGEVWIVPTRKAQFLVVLHPDKRCSVWARTADPQQININLNRLAASLAKPGRIVKKVRDMQVPVGQSSAYQLSYEVRQVGVHQALLLLATTSTDKKALSQAVLTLSPIS